MPTLHAFFPSTPDRGQEWAFATVRSRLAGDYCAFATTFNPFTRQEDLTIVVGGVYQVTVSFETGPAVDRDLESIADGVGAGYSRIRVLGGPDPDNDHSDVFVVLMDHFESLGQVLVYGAEAESVFVDTLSRTAD
jgi:hypothetical protein